MAKHLEKDNTLPLYLATGSVLVIKSTSFDLVANGNSTVFRPGESHLDLYNKDDNITLRIKFRKGQKKIFCNDRASKSIGDGWGKERSTDLGPIDDGRSGYRSITISVYTDSSHRYQILFDLTTVCYFNSRFPGPALRMTYSAWGGPFTEETILSNILQVKNYRICDLQPEEKQAIESGRAPSAEIPGLDSMAISIRPSHFIPNQTYATISWDEGKEIRIYHLGPGNTLQEYAYSESKDRNSLYYGDLHKLNIVLGPTFSLAAVRHQDEGICIFFQDPSNGFIRTLNKASPTEIWRNDPAAVAKAVKGSGIAAIMDCNGLGRYRVFFQDPQLNLREYCRGRSSDPWSLGEFNPGVQPRKTPITAEIVHGGHVDVNVMWRDEQGRAVSTSWTEGSGWDLPNANGGRTQLDGRD